MKELLALVLVLVVAAMAGARIETDYGEHWWARAAYLPIQVLAAGLWCLVAWIELRRKRRHGQAERAVVEENIRAATRDDGREYHHDCVAWAEGTLSWEQFLRKWAGRVPEGPRASERRKEEREIALFKEVMGTDFGELYLQDGQPVHRCRVSLGLHEDGPCRCEEPKRPDVSDFGKGEGRVL